MGLFFDVTSAFLAFSSSALIQSNMLLLEGALDDISLLNLRESEHFLQRLLTGSTTISSFRLRGWRPTFFAESEMLDRIKSRIHQFLNEGLIDENEAPQSHNPS